MSNSIEEELKQTGHIVFTNKGISMMPLLRQDKDIMMISAKSDGFKKNDAVLFKRDNGQYILHRLISVNPDGTYFIRGDNCIKGENVRKDQMLGILTGVIRDGVQTDITDKSYIRYVKSVPFRRIYLIIKHLVYRVLRKIYHTFIKRDKK